MSDTRPYEDECQALNQSIMATGCNNKEIAVLLYPGSKISTSQTTVSRMLDPASSVNMTVRQMKAIMRRTRAEDMLYYLCDEFGFERPPRKKGALEAEMKLKVEGLQRQMSELLGMMQKSENQKLAGYVLQQDQGDVDRFKENIAQGLRKKTGPK